MTEFNEDEEPSVIDFETLLAPISEEAPGGVDLREDPAKSKLFYALRDARKQEVDNERTRQVYESIRKADQKIMDRRDENDRSSVPALETGRTPNWPNVVKLATNLISEHSKDLWATAWLMESLVRVYGIAGIRDGFKFCRLLCEKYLDSVQPRPAEDENHWEWTFAQLDGLNVSIPSFVPNIPLLDKSVLGSKVREFSTHDYREAEKLVKLDSAERSMRISDGATTLDDFAEVIRKSDLAWLKKRLATIKSALRELDAYYSYFSNSECNFSPSFAEIESSVQAYLDFYQRLIKNRLEAEEKSEVVQHGGNGNIETAIAASATDSSRLKPILTRDDALEGILRVADFFRRTEPHSPVSYALEQAVRWGHMPLPELFRDLVSEDAVRESVFKRLGIREKDFGDFSDDSSSDDS